MERPNASARRAVGPSIPGLLGLAIAVALVEPSVAAAAEAPFDKARYEGGLSLSRWLEEDELERRWKGRDIALEGVYLVAGGQGEMYASFCAGGGPEATDEDVIDTGCPHVYLGTLPPEEAAVRLTELGGRSVDVYLTVGQIVPAPFAKRFGMIEAATGAWIDDSGTFFHIDPDSRVFQVPEDYSPGRVSAEPSAGELQPARPAGDDAEFFTYAYRSVSSESRLWTSSRFQPLNRASLLRGPTELRVETSRPDWYAIESIEVWGAPGLYQAGGRKRLCASADVSDPCVADFEGAIAGQRFTFDTTIRDGDDARRVLSRTFTTLDTHISQLGTVGTSVYHERDRVQSHPPDDVLRLVRIESVEGAGQGQRRVYRTDLPESAFRVDVAGIRNARITRLTRPDEGARLLLPIFVNVAPYLLARDRGDTLDWKPTYTGDDGLVFNLVEGLRSAVRRGVDAEFMVVSYGATARLFGPFELHPGGELGPDREQHNERTLADLTQHLSAPPLPEWKPKREGSWVSDFSSPLHTLNDLYFREYPGLVGALLITDGTSNPQTSSPSFQLDLWPQRVQQLGGGLSPERTAAILDMLDHGRSLRDEAVSRFLAALDQENPPAAERLADYLRERDPGGTQTLRPNKQDRVPLIDVLMVPSAVSLRRDEQARFSDLIREQFGGEIYRLFKLDGSEVEKLEAQPHDPQTTGGTRTVGGAILMARDQLRGSYQVSVQVPNQKHDGARHDLRFQVVIRQGKKEKPLRHGVRYVPHYTSSRSTSEKLPTLVSSPFEVLRLLAAYEMRNQWDDDRLMDLLARREQSESDPAIRGVLAESSIVAQLKRLQITADEILDPRRRQAYVREAHDELQELGVRADRLPDPVLARRAALLAAAFAEDYPERFGEMTRVRH